MNEISILDCTLRDGGFINEWLFGHECILNMIRHLDSAGIEYIEVGYLRENVEYCVDSTEFPNTWAIKDSIGGIETKASLVAIIDYGKCSLDRVGLQQDTVIDGIRITFRKNEIGDAIEFASKIQRKGYKVFLQPVAITDYNANEIADFVVKANEINPYAVCMVDTYGFMDKQDLIRCFYLFDSMLKEKIILGYHSHNNYQLSYANAIELIELDARRPILIDATAFGMGKGAGNLNTELVTAFINRNIENRYDVDHVLEIISVYLEKIKENHPWGYNLRYFIAASTDTHHQYANYLLNKKTLSVKSINTILSEISDVHKTRYDEEYIESLYYKYQNNEINDSDTIRALKSVVEGREVLLLAPGRSIDEEKNKIEDYIIDKNPIVISANNYIEDYHQDFIFISNSIRYSQIEDSLIYNKNQRIGIIATSNITPAGIMPDWVVNYEGLLVGDKEIASNCMLMLVKLMIKVGVKQVSIAGFDGYTGVNDYYKVNISLANNLSNQNSSIVNALRDLKREIDIILLTDSCYI